MRYPSTRKSPASVPGMLGQWGWSTKHSLTWVFLQVYMFKCVWRCYKLMKYMNSAEENSSSKMLPKVSLGMGRAKPQPCHSPHHLGQVSLLPWVSVSPLVR